MNLQPATLTGRFVQLEPHCEALREAVRTAFDTDPAAWEIILGNGAGEGFESWWSDARREAQEGVRIAFAVRRLSDGAIVGSTSMMNIRREHDALEIGWTFYQPDARGGPINPEAKLLLMAHAFATGAVRVEINTDARNLHSRAAILKLGAKQEGVLRKHKTTWKGHRRDTMTFAVIDDDWTQVKAGLEARLAQFS